MTDLLTIPVSNAGFLCGFLIIIIIFLKMHNNQSPSLRSIDTVGSVNMSSLTNNEGCHN